MEKPPWTAVITTEVKPGELTKREMDKEIGIFLEILEKNTGFQEQLLLSREKLGIPPTGYKPQEWLENNILNEYGLDSDSKINLPTYKERVTIETEFIRKFNILPPLDNQLINVVYANFVEIPLHKIQLIVGGPVPTSFPNPNIQITISGKASIKEIKDFVEANKEDIRAQMEVFYSPNIKTLSEKGVETYLRKTVGSETFAEIERDRDEDESGHGINTKDTLIDTDRVKKEYYRTKRKIESINKK